jgi:hypothetical protein
VFNQNGSKARFFLPQATPVAPLTTPAGVQEFGYHMNPVAGRNTQCAPHSTTATDLPCTILEIGFGWLLVLELYDNANECSVDCSPVQFTNPWPKTLACTRCTWTGTVCLSRTRRHWSSGSDCVRMRTSSTPRLTGVAGMDKLAAPARGHRENLYHPFLETTMNQVRCI